MTPPVTEGQRVFTCCHSFHCFTPPILDELAHAAGFKTHVQVGTSSIGGSTVLQHWDVPDAQNEAKTALRTGKVDVLTLSPIWLPEEGIVKFAQLALAGNPRVRVTVQEYWLPNDEYVPVYPLQVGKPVDHNVTDLAKLHEAQDRYDHDIDEYVRAINRQLGTSAVFTVPAGQAVVALREKIAAGQALCVKTQAELFTDSWGHAALPIQVLATYCHYAVIYRHSPVGLPMPSALRDAKNPHWDEKLNRLLQELAWDAVIHHPLSGVRGK